MHLPILHLAIVFVGLAAAASSEKDEARDLKRLERVKCIDEERSSYNRDKPLADPRKGMEGEAHALI